MFKISGNLRTILVIASLIFIKFSVKAQVKWISADAYFAPLPKAFHVFKTTDFLDGKPFRAYYAVASLKNKKLLFTADTTYKRRLTPTGFFEKNEKEKNRQEKIIAS